ncbi:MAG: polysaccharide deacetylase family protein [Gemmatimonadaceae bacterium]
MSLSQSPNSNTPASPIPPPATVHVDLDGAQDIYEGHGWSYPHGDDPIFESGLRSFLHFFSENGIKATLFVIARSLEDPRKRALIEAAVEQGHEIASHSLTHSYLTQIDSAGKRREIGESKQLLERELGVQVKGFRAPGYRIDYESLELLADSGYEYDSSAFPTAKYAAALRTTVDTLRAPHYPLPGKSLVEWSMPDHRPSPVPFNPSYSLLLGGWLFRSGLDRFRRSGRPLALLFHLIDLADPLAPSRLRGFSSKVFTLSTMSAERKRQRCQAMLEQVQRHYRIITTAGAIAEMRNAGSERAALGSAGGMGAASA